MFLFYLVTWAVRSILVKTGYQPWDFTGRLLCGGVYGKTYSVQFWRSGVDTGWESNGTKDTSSSDASLECAS